jgi:hypothetical protein
MVAMGIATGALGSGEYFGGSQVTHCQLLLRTPAGCSARLAHAQDAENLPRD